MILNYLGTNKEWIKNITVKETEINKTKFSNLFPQVLLNYKNFK